MKGKGDIMQYGFVMLTYFSLFTAMRAMDNPLPQGPKDPNFALITATINGPLDQDALSDINFLFTIGADPNFRSHLLDITPLMRAVRINNPQLVELLLEKGAKVNVSDPNDRFVRNFNIIYSRKKIMPLIISITNQMLRIKTHNTMNPHNPMDYRDSLYCMKQSQIIRNALLIDTILEQHRAYSDIADYRHPLLKMLRDSRVRRALLYVLNNCLADLPENVRYMLCNKKIPRTSSAPDPLLTYPDLWNTST